MTIAQFIVAYAVCWWLVLFMVLPSGAAPEKNPAIGNAPSAPANPRLRKKFWRTTWLAILPTILIYFVATAAKAEEGMYHVGGGCKTLTKHVPAADVAVRDGYGVGDAQVKGANLEGGHAFDGLDSIDIPIQIPSKNYVNENNYNVDLSHSFIEAGTLTVKQSGEALLNGKSITDSTLTTGECNETN